MDKIISAFGRKKLLFLASAIALLAAACNNQGTVAQPNPSQPTSKPPQQQTQTKPVDETANWKTYSNTRAGYSFEYPANMKVIDVFKYPNGNSQILNEDQVDVQPVIVNDAVPSGVDPNQYEIRVYVNEGYRSIADWITDTANTHGVGGTNASVGHNLSKYQKITITAQTGYKLVQPNEVFLAFMANSNVYTIRVFDESNKNYFNNFQTLSHLISSFKFTNTTSQNQTSKNKVYTDAYYPFSIQYPTTATLQTPGEKAVNFPENTYSYLGRFSGDLAFISLAIPKNSGIARADVLISFSDTPSADPNNPSNIQYSFSAVDKSQGVPPPTIDQLNLKETVNINGITWGLAEKTGVAAGTASHVKIYHTYHNDLWYEVQINLWTQSDGTTPVDGGAIGQQLQNILSSFKFTK